MKWMMCITCPALATEQRDLVSCVEAKMKSWQVPFSHKLVEPVDKRTCRLWSRRLRKSFSEASITSDRLCQLTEDYWRANCHKSCPSFRKLCLSVQRVIRECR